MSGVEHLFGELGSHLVTVRIGDCLDQDRNMVKTETEIQPWKTQQPYLTGILFEGRGVEAMQSYLFHLYVETTLQHVLVLLITTLLFCFILTPTMDSNFTKKMNPIIFPVAVVIILF